MGEQQPSTVADLVECWKQRAASGRAEVDRLTRPDADRSEELRRAAAGYVNRSNVYETAVAELVALLEQAGGTCAMCGGLLPSTEHLDLTAEFMLPPEPEVGRIVEIIGGRLDRVWVVRRLSSLAGWQVFADPGSEWHSWPSVFALARRAGGDGRLRLVPA